MDNIIEIVVSILIAYYIVKSEQKITSLVLMIYNSTVVWYKHRRNKTKKK